MIDRKKRTEYLNRLPNDLRELVIETEIILEDAFSQLDQDDRSGVLGRRQVFAFECLIMSAATRETRNEYSRTTLPRHRSIPMPR